MSNTQKQFASRVCIDDRLTVDEGLFSYTARIVLDLRTKPSDFANYTPYSPAEITAWENGKWMFNGMVVSAEYNGISLGDLTSLYGIETNMPGSDNSYLTSTFYEVLLPEAREQALIALETLRSKLAA